MPIPSLRRRVGLLAAAVLAFAGCRSAVMLPPADAIVEGRTAIPAGTDTVADGSTVRVARATWPVRSPVAAAPQDFWSDIATLDMPAAQLSARSLDERTFVAALRTLMTADPEGAAIAFRALALNAKDFTVRARARIGLTMALSWRSEWTALSELGPDPDSAEVTDSLVVRAGVERWGRALSQVSAPVVDVPVEPVTMPIRKSAFGTPVVTVHVNGRPHEFWLDTGASMTLLSDRVAVQSGVKLAARDTLALGVVAGHIPARAVYVDSLKIGPMVVRGLGAALVSHDALRLDHAIVNGARKSVQIDGVIGTDLLRHLDLVIDAGARTLTMRRPVPNPRAVRNMFWVGYPVVRLMSRTGRPVLFGIDTGAEGTYVTTTLLKKLPRTPVAMRRGSIGGLGRDDVRTDWVARELTFSDGDHVISLRNAPVTPERRWTFVTFDGVLGSDVALASRMHLDFLNGVFDVRRSSSTQGTTSVTVGHQ